MLEVLDKVNDIYEVVPYTEFVIHPNGCLVDLELLDEYKDVGKFITGVVFKRDGSTLVLYEKRD